MEKESGAENLLLKINSNKILYCLCVVTNDYLETVIFFLIFLIFLIFNFFI